MTTDHKEALEHLKVVRETIDLSTSNRFYRTFAYSMGPTFLVSGLLVLGCVELHRHLQAVGNSNGAIIGMWIGAVAIMSLMKMLVMRSIGKREDLTLWQFIKKMTPKEFWKVDIPLESSAFFAIVYCFHSNHTQFIIPIIIMMSGHFITVMGVLFRIPLFVWFGYAWVAMAILGLFFFLKDILLLTTLAMGVIPTIMGIIMMIKYGGKDGGRR